MNRGLGFPEIFSSVLYLLILISIPGFAQKYTLFNGENLEGWEVQGEGEWTVEEGEIRGYKSADKTDWAHLVSNEIFDSAFIRIEYKIIEGNSGLYIRSEIEGIFGVTGVQVEMGANDGTAMTVTETEWKWLPEAPFDTGQATRGEWNTLEVEMAGGNFKSWVNGQPVFSRENLPDSLMPEEGRLAVQLHAGTYANSLALKSVEVFVPTRITGCGDSAYAEFSPDVNDHDSTLCVSVTLGPQEIPTTLERPWSQNSRRDIRGRRPMGRGKMPYIGGK